MKPTDLPDVRGVIQRSTIDGNRLTLPTRRVDPELRTRVVRVIELAGGRWSERREAFMFSSDPQAALDTALGQEQPVRQRKAAQATPERLGAIAAEIAESIAKLSMVSGHRVLHPAAGDGTVADACLAAGATQVDCVDGSHANLSALKGKGKTGHICDFLTMRPNMLFKRIVMCPPTASYWEYIEAALGWLDMGGKLFAVVPDNRCEKLEALGATTVTLWEPAAFGDVFTGNMRLVVVTGTTRPKIASFTHTGHLIRGTKPDGYPLEVCIYAATRGDAETEYTYRYGGLGYRLNHPAPAAKPVEDEPVFRVRRATA